MTKEKCTHHVVIKSGYLAWHTWAEEQNKKGIEQKQCPDCGFYFFPQEMGKKPKQRKG